MIYRQIVYSYILDSKIRHSLILYCQLLYNLILYSYILKFLIKIVETANPSWVNWMKYKQAGPACQITMPEEYADQKKPNIEIKL